ncbi:hypothetical protein CKAH01_14649 [Colletotrichum kahawae]|uniref:Uncharacterized protein n=1 Tax=Colletotrichum kahawae TaxID=34407 RepID=A0AAD9YLJ7_COLKA|nr:hypothetical protein CKAH01_14649 [Colletotrichum kahawae]
MTQRAPQRSPYFHEPSFGTNTEIGTRVCQDKNKTFRNGLRPGNAFGPAQGEAIPLWAFPKLTGADVVGPSTVKLEAGYQGNLAAHVDVEGRHVYRLGAVVCKRDTNGFILENLAFAIQDNTVLAFLVFHSTKVKGSTVFELLLALGVETQQPKRCQKIGVLYVAVDFSAAEVFGPIYGVQELLWSFRMTNRQLKETLLYQNRAEAPSKAPTPLNRRPFRA